MPSTWSVPDSEPRRPILMQSPSVSTLLGSPGTQWSNFSPRAATHCNSLMVPLTAMSSSSPVIRNEIEPFGWPPVQKAILDVARKRAVAPCCLVARRHHVGMPGKRDVRRGCADPGIEIVDIGRAWLAEGDAVGLEAGRFQDGFKHRKRAGIGRGYGRAAQEIAGDREGVSHA